MDVTLIEALTVVGVFAVALGSIALLWKAVNENSHLVPPEVIKDAFEQLAESVVRIVEVQWTQYGEHVKATPNKTDDIVYQLGDVPIDLLIEHLKGRGVDVNPTTPVLPPQG